MYHFDPSIFANPNYGLTNTEAGKMTGSQHEVGRGKYFSMNQTGAETVSLGMHLSGAKMQLFRADWENRAKLNYGAGWFTMELPKLAFVPYDTTATQPGFGTYVVHFSAPFSASRYGFNHWTITMDLDVDTAPQRITA